MYRVTWQQSARWSKLLLVIISRLTIVSSMRLIRSTLVYSRLGSLERIRDAVFDTRKWEMRELCEVSRPVLERLAVQRRHPHTQERRCCICPDVRLCEWERGSHLFVFTWPWRGEQSAGWVPARNTNSCSLFSLLWRAREWHNLNWRWDCKHNLFK